MVGLVKGLRDEIGSGLQKGGSAKVNTAAVRPLSIFRKNHPPKRAISPSSKLVSVCLESSLMIKFALSRGMFRYFVQFCLFRGILPGIFIHQFPYHFLVFGVIPACLVFKKNNAGFFKRYGNFYRFFRKDQFFRRWQIILNPEHSSYWFIWVFHLFCHSIFLLFANIRRQKF